MKYTLIKEFLQKTGLSINETNVYLGALKVGNGIVKEIARQAHLNRTTTYNILLHLRSIGLVASYKKNNIIHFSATDPRFIEDLLDKRIADQQKLKMQLENLLPDMDAIFNTAGRGAGVRVFEGIENLPEIYSSLYKGVRYPDEGMEFTNWGKKYDLFPQSLRLKLIKQLKKSDVWVRSLLIEDDITTQWQESNEGKKMQKRIRLLPNPGWDFFVNFEMVKERIAVVTYKNDVDFQGMLIESKELSAMFQYMFEALWNSTEKEKE